MALIPQTLRICGPHLFAGASARSGGANYCIQTIRSRQRIFWRRRRRWPRRAWTNNAARTYCRTWRPTSYSPTSESSPESLLQLLLTIITCRLLHLELAYFTYCSKRELVVVVVEIPPIHMTGCQVLFQSGRSVFLQIQISESGSINARLKSYLSTDSAVAAEWLETYGYSRKGPVRITVPIVDEAPSPTLSSHTTTQRLSLFICEYVHREDTQWHKVRAEEQNRVAGGGGVMSMPALSAVCAGVQFVSL
ncbi:hypothetical protein B0H17DRAFT_647266 [Mycena rosella]|uniref:Uncharacterized protein n=1 Tax=Mycena rosella TaxID=1033263 RepID=A0AAD7DDX5_MYCRO|nr:hypothetical protein B0H17DRAFT_647266 [Mycena rosella]